MIQITINQHFDNNGITLFTIHIFSHRIGMLL